jgi:hypothetical protein
MRSRYTLKKKYHRRTKKKNYKKRITRKKYGGVTQNNKLKKILETNKILNKKIENAGISYRDFKTHEKKNNYNEDKKQLDLLNFKKEVLNRRLNKLNSRYPKQSYLKTQRKIYDIAERIQTIDKTIKENINKNISSDIDEIITTLQKKKEKQQNLNNLLTEIINNDNNKNRQIENKILELERLKLESQTIINRITQLNEGSKAFLKKIINTPIEINTKPKIYPNIYNSKPVIKKKIHLMPVLLEDEYNHL